MNNKTAKRLTGAIIGAALILSGHIWGGIIFFVIMY